MMKYFIAAAEEGSISKAARRLHITQPALTHSILMMEEEYGTELVHRSKQGITLTEAGIRLLEMSRRICDLSDQMDLSMHDFTGELTGEIRFATALTGHSLAVYEAFAELKRKHPGLHLHVYSEASDIIRKRILEGLDDFGLIYGPVDTGRFSSIPLPEKDTWCVCMKSDDPLSARKSVVPDDLRKQPLIFPERIIRTVSLQEWFGTPLSKLNITASYTTGADILNMVKAGLGYGMMFLDTPLQTENSSLAFIPLENSPEESAHIIYRKTTAPTAAADALLKNISVILKQ